jgi:hypothetical protein
VSLCTSVFRLTVANFPDRAPAPSPFSPSQLSGSAAYSLLLPLESKETHLNNTELLFLSITTTYTYLKNFSKGPLA